MKRTSWGEILILVSIIILIVMSSLQSNRVMINVEFKQLDQVLPIICNDVEFVIENPNDMCKYFINNFITKDEVLEHLNRMNIKFNTRYIQGNIDVIEFRIKGKEYNIVFDKNDIPFIYHVYGIY